MHVMWLGLKSRSLGGRLGLAKDIHIQTEDANILEEHETLKKLQGVKVKD